MRILFSVFLIIISIITSNSRGGSNAATVIPISTDQIQMLENKIKMTFGGTWYIETTATYKNFGPDSTVQIGFPYKLTLPHNYEEELSKKRSERKYDKGFYDPQFKTFIDGKSIPITAKRTWEHPELEKFDYSTIYIFDVHFDEDEIKTISHTYTTAGIMPNFYEDSKYLINLETGSLWKNKINLLEIEMRLPEKFSFDLVSPQEHSCILDDSYGQIVLFWRHTDFEPDSNIAVTSLSYKEKSRTLDQYIKISGGFIQKYGNVGIRYLRNLVYAHYGYPFTNPSIRASFYSSGRYSENENYFDGIMSSYHKEFLVKLKEMEREEK